MANNKINRMGLSIDVDDEINFKAVCDVLNGKKSEPTNKQGTQTEQNLLKSFAGESQARNRYSMFAAIAKKEGFEQIAAIFTETADQEYMHAKKFFRYLEGGMVEITAMYPAGIEGTTAENLKASADGENEEWADLYPHFAEIADAEGFSNIAATWRKIAAAEKGHEEAARAARATRP